MTLDTERDWRRLRELRYGPVPLNLNPGTLGTPALGVDAAIAEFNAQARGWPLRHHEGGRRAMAEARAQISSWAPLPNAVLGFGATAQMAAWMPALVARFGRVRLLTSTEEHDGALYGILRHPAFVVDQVPPEHLVDEASARRHDVVLCSEVTWTDGRRLPLAAIRAATDAWLIADAAQVVGLDVPFSDADLVIASLHKWVGGPAGTGVTWMSPRAVAELKAPIAAGHPIDADHPLGAFEPAGAQDFARWAGLRAAGELIAEVGVDRARRRTRALGGRLAEGLGTVLGGWGARFMGEAGWQDAPTVAPGHVVVVHTERDPYPLYRALGATHVHVKCIKGEGRQQLRFGVPWYEDESRVELALARIAAAVAP